MRYISDQFIALWETKNLGHLQEHTWGEQGLQPIKP